MTVVGLMDRPPLLYAGLLTDTMWEHGNPSVSSMYFILAAIVVDVAFVVTHITTGLDVYPYAVGLHGAILIGHASLRPCQPRAGMARALSLMGRVLALFMLVASWEATGSLPFRSITWLVTALVLLATYATPVADHLYHLENSSAPNHDPNAITFLNFP